LAGALARQPRPDHHAGGRARSRRCVRLSARRGSAPPPKNRIL